MLNINTIGPKHPLVKYCRQLAKAYFRKKEGKLVLEGIHALEEAASAGVEIEMVFFTDDFLEKQVQLQLFKRIVATNKKAELFRVSPKVLNHIAQTKTSQGILAIAVFPSFVPEEYLSDENPFLVIVDGIQDPGNLGTIIRSSAGAGVDCVITLEGSVDLANAKVLRSSAGALFRLPVFYWEDQLSLYKNLQARNIKLFGTSPREGTVYYETDFRKPTAVVIGNENSGIRPFWKKLLSEMVTIPLYNTESLNAAVAAGIIIFEVRRQRGFHCFDRN